MGCTRRRIEVKFGVVADFFERIEAEQSRLAITELLAGLFKKASDAEIGVLSFMALGQLKPPYIGTQFNIADKTMIKIIASLCGLTEKKIVEKKKKIGDLGSLALMDGWKVTGDPSVMSVYKQLCHIEEIAGTGSQEKKEQELLTLLRELTPVSAKYVIRMVMGKLRLGFSDMTLIDALSWMEVGNKSLRKVIEHAYNICVDIGYIASTLKKKGIEAIKKIQIRVGIPIRPAAAERLPTAKAILEKIGPCVAQPKLDGFRLQIHIKKFRGKRKIQFFSRNLQDMSPMFPDLTCLFEQLPVDDLICEGEAIVYDSSTGSFVPFQETVKRKRKHGVAQAAQELPLQAFIFDVLYYDGKSLLDTTHEERRKVLKKIFDSWHEDTIKVIKEKKIKDTQALKDYFLKNIEAGLEGLVIKRPDAVYTPGKRNFNWIKLKRQEEGQLEDTIDVVILGYYAGSGRRAAFGIGAFLAGVFNKKRDQFETIAKVGTGLSDKEWRDLKKQCDRIAVNKKPTNVICNKNLYPDVWVSLTLVCLVRADEITLSPTHSAGKAKEQLGYALRFPRFMGYRPDKNIEQATTVKELERLYEDQWK